MAVCCGLLIIPFSVLPAPSVAADQVLKNESCKICSGQIATSIARQTQVLMAVLLRMLL